MMRISPNIVFSNTNHRPDSHGLRYEFRHLVNAGLVRVAQYEEFVRWVDASGGLTAAMRTVDWKTPLTL